LAQQRQVNIRVEDADFEALETAAFLHRRTVADEMRAAVLEYLNAARMDPRFARAEELRDEPDTDGERQGVVRSLNTSSRREAKGGRAQ